MNRKNVANIKHRFDIFTITTRIGGTHFFLNSETTLKRGLLHIIAIPYILYCPVNTQVPSYKLYMGMSTNKYCLSFVPIKHRTKTALV